MSQDLPVSWEEFHRYSKALAWQLKEKGAWKGIIAIARGGLVPAAIVAQTLNIKIVETVSMSTYQDFEDPSSPGYKKQEQTARILKPIGIDVGDGAGWLIVEDLVDTGNTAKILRKMLPGAHIAAVYAKPQGAPHADTVTTTVSQDTWIHFPWEMSSPLNADAVERMKNRK